MAWTAAGGWPTLDAGGDTAEERRMQQRDKGPAMVIGPEEGASFWQPAPCDGYITVKVSPFNSPSNQYALGIQVLPPGGSIRKHGHARSDEILFVYEGTGTATVDGKAHKLEPGSTVVTGRFVEHGVVNDGTVDLKLMWLVLPPGLESFFEAVGRPRVPGEPPPARFGRPADFDALLDKAWYAKPEQLVAD
jgi:quercetin dioxygenase-like cupin family protein